MALADAFAEAARTPNPSCGLGKVIAELPDDDRATLARYMSNLNVTHTLIEKALTTEGHKVSAFVIGRHRQGRCGCVAV